MGLLRQLHFLQVLMDTRLHIKQKRIKAEQAVAVSFFLSILLGSLLLALPVSAADGQATPYMDALFTAATAVCVTGLVTVTTAVHWSLFGKAVILILIQIGGLGIMSIMTMFFLALRRRITLGEQKLLKESYNLLQLEGVVGLVKKIVLGTLAVEGAGAVLYACCLVPVYGPGNGVFMSVFNAVSCFCNAGMDIIGPDSLKPFVSNPLMNITTMLLIILGGIGFIVWWDVLNFIKNRSGRRKRRNQQLGLHTKLVLIVTALLIVGGTVLILAFEWNNPDSIGNLPLPEKVMAAAFQSVTTRTAGFETIAQASFTDATALLSMVLMFVGGSPLGTAGGMKTTTAALVVLLVSMFIRGDDGIVLFHRRISMNNVRTAVVVVAVGLTAAVTGTMLLSLTVEADFLDVAYEVVSALGTVGLTRGLTPNLAWSGKLIVIVIMYMGRIGPITLMLALVRKKRKKQQVQYPEQQIMIG